MTPLKLLMQSLGEAGAPAVGMAPEDQVAPEDLTATGTMKKKRKMKDRGNEDVNAGGGSQSAQMGEMKVVALMDLEILPMTDHALPPGDGERLPLSGIRFLKS